MRFVKMHETGNDYVILDCTKQEPELDPGRLTELISTRHFGVGADGLIVIRSSEKADFGMDVYDPDGTAPCIYGNGLRCLAKYVYENGLTNMTSLSVETAKGVFQLELNVKNEKLLLASIHFESPSVLVAERRLSLREGLPGDVRPDEIVKEAFLGEKAVRFVLVSLGGPTAIVMADDVDLIHVEERAPLISALECIPDGTGVAFVQLVDRSNLKLRAWEKGVGEVLSSGTASAAALVAMNILGYTESSVKVRMAGGALTADWIREDDNVLLTGPATEVYQGELSL